MQTKIAFTVEKDGKALRLMVKRPSLKAQQDAQVAYARAFADFVKAGALLKAKLDGVVREQNLWDDARQAELDRLQGQIAADEKVVKGHVKGTTKKAAREAALRLRRARAEVRALLADRTALEANTAEGQAEQARYNHLVAHAVVYEDTGERYFASVEDYLAREDDPAALPAANHFANLYYGIDPDYEKSLPENQFLVAQGMVDDKLRLVKDVNGVKRLCDADGRLVDEAGRYVNEAGEYVDRDGNRVDEKGQPVAAEVFPFEDDPAA